MSKGKEVGSTADGSATPKAAVARLSLYLRELEASIRVGQETISSNQLGAALEVTDAQVRKDLAYFGQFGYPGIGYRVAELRDAIRHVLGTDQTWETVLIGVGNLGMALLGHQGFAARGFSVIGLFDKSPRLVGRIVHGMKVAAVDELPRFVRDKKIRMAILTVPTEAAQEASEIIVQSGIEGILNFAPVQLKVPENVNVVSVDVGLQLEQLAFQVSKPRIAVTSPHKRAQ